MMLGVTHEIIRLFAFGVSETPLGFAGGVVSFVSTVQPEKIRRIEINKVEMCLKFFIFTCFCLLKNLENSLY